MDALAYQSYCWSMGTTSFRMTEMNRKIEQQLAYLDEFWSRPGMKGASWGGSNAIQKEYYGLLKEKGFVSGDAPRPDKDAREKTSGIVELGLVDDERRLTAAGRDVLAISKDGDFSADDNVMEISRDSYRYFLQLLKASKNVGDMVVRPFVVFLHVMMSVGRRSGGRMALTWNEFSLLIPLCIDKYTTDIVVDKITRARQAGVAVDTDAVISEIVLDKPNYKSGLQLLVSAGSVDENLICDIGINRKSRQYDKVYFSVYEALHELVFSGVTSAGVRSLVRAIEKLNGNIPLQWKRYLFGLPPGGRLKKNPISQLYRQRPIFTATTEEEFRKEFYRLLQLFKARATLSDYADLNRRYFSLSDVVIFRDGEVVLDDLPKALLARFSDWLESSAFLAFNNPGDVLSLHQILQGEIPSKETLFLEVSGLSEQEVHSRGGLRKVMHDHRYSRFMGFLHERFPRHEIALLLRKFEDRANDSEVQNKVTDAADVPTIFEYVVGLAWYYLSGEQGDVLEFLNLSLGPDFLPKSHAGGGEADILWRYEANPPDYGKHALLVEVTLAEKDNQRRMEMEPVSRHLGDFMIANPADGNSYCAFVTTALNPNVIADFRGKRNQIYYNSSNPSEKVHGLKIIPIETKVLSGMLEQKMSYSEVYDVFDRHYEKNEEPLTWYEDLVSEINGEQSEESNSSK